jgi:type IV pilus assembly protein PilQ
LNGRIKRRSSTTAFIGAIVVLNSLGCHFDNKIQRRSIDELYGDALAKAAQRPSPVQHGFKTAPSSHFILETSASPAPLNGQTGPAVTTIPSTDADSAGRGEDWIRKEDVSTTDNAPIKSDPFDLIPPVSDALNDAFSSNTPQVAPADDTSASDSNSNGTPDRMTDVFDQTDIFEVIQILSAHYGVQIIADDTIVGAVTTAIEDETLDEALNKILLPLGLIHAEHEGRYIIAPPDPASPLFSFVAQRSTYSPSNHNVVSLVSLLPPRFRTFIQTSPERNIAVIEAPDRLLKEIVTRLAELDTPIGQVELEAIVCVVSPDSGFRFGFDWNHVVGINDAQSLKIGLAGLALSGSGSKQGIQDAFSDFAVTSAFMRLLAQEGYITIRAAPRVTARDGEKASISLNRETFFSLQPDSSNVFFRQDVQKVEAGISLEIVPRIHGDMIAVEIAKAEVSEDIRSSTNADVSSNPYPIINRRVVSTKVNVRDGNTIVIGGLVQRQTVDKINRIPILSGLPAVGKLFQTIEKQEQDVEVAVFISPRIVPVEPETCAPSADALLLSK